MSEDLHELRQKIEDHEQRIESLEKKVDNTPTLDKDLSMAEFVNNECNASTHKERVVAIGYYFEAYTDKESFDKNDLSEGYTRCGSSKTNFNARASESVSEGWLKIEDNGRPRQWSITKTGAQEVEKMRSTQED